MEECFSVVKSRVKISWTTTWKTAPQRVLAKRMTAVVLKVSWTPFGSWCRVQLPRFWLTSNSDTTMLDCSWHASEARRGLVSSKDNHYSRMVWAGIPQGSVISQPSLTPLCRNFPSLTLTWRPTLMTLRCWPLLPASWGLRKRPTNFLQPWWGGQMENCWPLLLRNPAWLCLLRSDTHQFWPHPQVRIGDEVALHNRTPKILNVTLDSYRLHLQPSCPRLCRASSEVPQHYEALCWVKLGLFERDVLVGTFKAIVRPILNYAAPIWFTKGYSSRIATGNMPPKGWGVLSQNRDWGPPTALAAVLYKRPTTYSPRSPRTHHSFLPPSKCM